jgi:hypothetical protein
LSCLVLCACNAFDASLVEVDAGGTEDTNPGVDTGEVDAPPPVMNGCTAEDPSRIPPGRSTAGSGDGEEVVFGLKEVGLNQSGDAWRDIGLNLDGLCSLPPVPRVECEPPNAPDAQPLIDGNGGIDNAFGAELFPLVELVFPNLDSNSLMAGEQGIGVVALRIRGWNGTGEDDRVDVTLSQSVIGTAGTAGETVPPPVFVVDHRLWLDEAATMPAPEPAWEGFDWLWLRQETFLMNDLEQPRVRDDNAYVTGNQLVVRLPDRVEIVFSDRENGIKVKLTDATAVGTFTDDFTRLSPVVVAGRWSIIDLLDTANNIGVCPDDPEFDLLVNQLNTVADVRATAGTGGEGVVCDAVSIGVSFEGYRARIAAATMGQPVPDACAAE